ncbi:twin-arginine translocation signal domain-containing protein [Palleronia sp.]|uniref:twin-arginine translocation signal domain-containing protein n=1 Tax=Palleronia sp. TaxID=1940284 RepID=UPI0035C87552
MEEEPEIKLEAQATPQAKRDFKPTRRGILRGTALAGAAAMAGSYAHAAQTRAPLPPFACPARRS